MNFLNLDTDYIFFGVAYGCGKIMGNMNEMLLVLSRNQSLDGKHQRIIDDKLINLELNFNMRNVTQNIHDCK